MATYVKRGSAWRVQVRKGGQSYSATFPSKAAAQQWAVQVESDIVSGRLGSVPDRPFKDVIDRYLREVTPKKRGHRAEMFRLKRTIDDELAEVRLRQLGPEHFAAWRDRRLNSVGAASVLREWATLSNVCNVAVREWRWLRSNPMAGLKKPDQPRPRQRLISQNEIDAIIRACGADYSTAQGRVGAAFLFAIETAMRAGEICGLTWVNVKERYAHIPVTKNGLSRDVPLSDKALKILNSLGTRGGEGVFNLTAASLDALFRKAKARAMVSGFTFHDARATALTALSRKLNVMQLARVSGHRDLRILQNVYYRETAGDIAPLLNDE